jgi:hypothetical protein
MPERGETLTGENMTSISADTIKAAASDAVDQLQRAATPALKQGTREAGILLDHSGALIESVRSGLGETASQLGNSLVAYTKKNPLIVLLLAVGAGALLVSAAKSRR